MIHHFFLTPQALYVLVADDRKQNTEFDYWFRIINLLGREKEEERIKVLVVLNQIGHTSVTNFDHATYQKNFPDLQIEKQEVDFAKADLRCTDLEKVIQKYLCTLPHVGDPLPRLWQPIRTALLEARKTQPHITFSAFSAICTQNYDGINLSRQEDQLYLSRYLHRLGVILHYEEDALFDFVVLDPQWAVKAVYALLKDKKVEHNNGQFTEADLKRKWKAYTPIERTQLLNLMLKDKFEICYRAPQAGTFIAPQMLPPKRPPYNWESASAMKFRYQYPFMPKGLISRLIVRLSDDIAGANKELVWKEGVIIAGHDCQAQILQHKTVKEGLEVLDIEVIGVERERKYLLRDIRKEVQKIHERS